MDSSSGASGELDTSRIWTIWKSEVIPIIALWPSFEGTVKSEITMGSSSVKGHGA
jgi:hypothetical protein